MPDESEHPTLYCSFCGKSQHEVKKLIAGPTVFICEECVVLCTSILLEGKEVKPEDLPAETKAALMMSELHDLLGQVKRLLEDEDRRYTTALESEERRHEPFKLLGEQLKRYEVLAAPPPEEPTVVEFPDQSQAGC